MPSLRVDDSKIFKTFQSNKWLIIAFLNSNSGTMISFFCSVSCQESFQNCFISEFIQSFVGSSTLAKILQGTLEVSGESAGRSTAEDFLQLPWALISPTWITNFESVSTQAIKTVETQAASLRQRWRKYGHINRRYLWLLFSVSTTSWKCIPNTLLWCSRKEAGEFMSQLDWSFEFLS